MNFNHKLLKKLTESNGISGYEGEVRNVIKDELSDLKFEEDNLGSLTTKIGYEGPNITIAAHMDEVGFIVNFIDEEGFIHFSTSGGWWNQVVLAQRVLINTNDNKKLVGIIGSKAPHILTADEKKKTISFEDMFIDIGVSSKEEALELGVEVGNQITLQSEYTILNNPNYVAGKALDDRIGVYIIIELLKKLESEKLSVVCIGGFTVQEEIGLRGAKVVGETTNPDLTIAIDTGIAGDTPLMDGYDNKCGGGPLICVMDATSIANVGLRNYLFDLAEELNIPYQADFLLKGGTDTGMLHKAHDGAASITLSIATRYLHSHVSVININDVNNLIELLYQFIIRLDKKTIESFK